MCVNSANSNVHETPCNIFGEKVYRQTYSRTHNDSPLGLSNCVFCGQKVRKKHNVQNSSELQRLFQTVPLLRPTER